MKNLFSLIIKEKKIVLTCIGVAFAAFLFYFIFMYKPLYASNAKIYIKDIPQGEGSLVKSESGYSNPLFNLAQVLKSRNTSDRVLSTLKTTQEKDLGKIRVKTGDEWHNYLSKHMRTKIIPSTDTLSLSLQWVNKDTTRKTLDEIITQFMAENMDLRKSVAVSQRKFLEKNLVEITNKLTGIRKQISDYAIAHNAIDVDTEKLTLVQSRVELEKDIETTRSKINYFNKKYKELGAQMGMPDVKVALRAASIGKDPYVEHLYTNLALSEQKFAEANSVFTENYPKVIAAKNEVKTLNDVIKDRFSQSFQDLKVDTDNIRGVYDESSQEVVKEMALAKAEGVSLANQLREMEKGVTNLMKKESALPSKIMGLEELKKQEEALKTAYEHVKAREMEAIMNENSVVNNIFVLDSPSKPAFVFADLLFKFIGFLYVGIIAGIAAAWIKDYLENKIKEDEMESFAV